MPTALDAGVIRRLVATVRRPRSDRQWSSRKWSAHSARRRAEHVAAVGWWCPGFGRTAHASTDLTLDHRTPMSQGGALIQGDEQVLCRGCNTRKMHVDRPDVAARGGRASAAARSQAKWRP